MYFILTRTVGEKLHKTNFLFYLFICAHFTNTLLPSIPDEEGRTEMKPTELPYLSFILFYFFPVSSFSSLVILRSNRIKKGRDRIPRSFMFLRVPLPYVLFQASPGSKG